MRARGRAGVGRGDSGGLPWVPEVGTCEVAPVVPCPAEVSVSTEHFLLVSRLAVPLLSLVVLSTSVPPC